MAIASQKSQPLPQPPPELANAIQNASKQYNVPPDLLVGIWHIESGSTFPNPAVNSSGYGGLFGTTDWNGSTQDQANLAASVLQAGLVKGNGNVAEALSYYNSGNLTGGYTNVPGQTTFGIIPNYNPNVPINPSHRNGGGGFMTDTANVAGTLFNTGLGPVLNAVGINSSDIGLPNQPSAQQYALNAVPSASKYILYGVAFLGGGLLILAGLALIGIDIGLGAYRRAGNNQTIRVVTSAAGSTRDRFKPEPEPQEKPVSLAERREARAQELHRAKVRRARAEARSAEHGANEAKRRAERARGITSSEISQLQMGK